MRAADQPKIQLSCAPDGGANYRAAVAGAGGLPGAGYCPAPDLTCDGLILCGGGDIHCAQYGQEDRGSHPPDLERDRAELALFRAFFAAGKPILGICRGLQLINVALGGTLIQDLPRALRDLHTSPQGDRVHTVRARPGSLLHRLYGPDFSVNSAHHQAIDRLGEGLTVSAWAEQDIPEALQWEDRRIFAVQFHPERMSFARRRPDTVDGEAVFRAFVEICRGNAPG